MNYFSSSHSYYPWVYTISHKSLLLRSPKSESGKNIDIMFSGTFYMELPDVFIGIEINAPSATELEDLESKCQSNYPDLSKVYFSLLTKGNSYYVGATMMKVEENSLSPNENHLLL